jgi:hypothetical protein
MYLTQVLLNSLVFVLELFPLICTIQELSSVYNISNVLYRNIIFQMFYGGIYQIYVLRLDKFCCLITDGVYIDNKEMWVPNSIY